MMYRDLRSTEFVVQTSANFSPNTEIFYIENSSTYFLFDFFSFVDLTLVSIFPSLSSPVRIVMTVSLVSWNAMR